MNFLLTTFFLIFSTTVQAAPLELPEYGAYIGAYIDAGPLSDTVRHEDIKEFEDKINKKLSWVYFSNNWLNGEISFPRASVQEILKTNTIPYIRIMPWSEVRTSGPDPIFTLDALLSDRYDRQLRQWAKDALKLKTHYILEFGPEVNGDWFSWSGIFNGAGVKTEFGDPNLPDGPEKFQHVYRKIVRLFREEGLTDTTWVLHLDTAWSPHAWWNHAHFYYPGDDYVDWIGLSAFGPQLPNHRWSEFHRKIQQFWPQIESLSLKKPVIISEFASIESRNYSHKKPKWLHEALSLVENQVFPIKAVTYWNSPGWLDGITADFRLTSSQKSLSVFREHMQKPFWKTPGVLNEIP